MSNLPRGAVLDRTPRRPWASLSLRDHAEQRHASDAYRGQREVSKWHKAPGAACSRFVYFFAKRVLPGASLAAYIRRV